MKISFLVRATIAAMFLVLMASVVSASPKATYQATFEIPSEIRTDKMQVVPITLTVVGSEGQPFSGRVEVWTNSGQFAKADGSLASDYPLSVDVLGGVAHLTLSFLGKEDWRSPLVVSATLGPYGQSVVLGQAEAKIRYQEFIEVSTPVPAALANGVASPVVAAVIKDQFGDPLDNVKVTARFKKLSERTQARATTNSDGIAYANLDPSTRSGYALGQVLTDRLASVQMYVLYGETKPDMISLRAKAVELGARVQWDPVTRTATATSERLRLQVCLGQDVAVFNGQKIPLGTTARVRNGHLEIPAQFAKFFL